MKYALPLHDKRATLENVGGKGASLARLAGAGLPVPGGFHVTTAAYRHFIEENELQDDLLAALQDVDVARPGTLEEASQAIRALFAGGEIPEEVAGAIVEMYGTLPGTNPAVAVRSSATAEDLPEASFAGQQETYLNVSGPEALLEATKKCWASLWTARAIGYRARQEIGPGEVALAVVVQLLAPAEVAGILFTAHPMTGERDRVLISAAWGLGEAVVGGAVTPDEIVVEKESGEVLGRETAEKEVMTVRVDGGTREEPVPQSLRRVPVLSDEAAAELAGLGLQIEELYGRPMDVEWTWADGRFSIVQARPITALPEAVVPDEWELPEGAYIAMRNNIVELMADPLSPLFATMGVEAINASMGRLLAHFFGRPDIMPEKIIIVVNGYAYYNGSLRAGPMARVLLGSVGIARRMFSGAVERWTDEGRPRYVATVQQWQARPWHHFPGPELLDSARQLTEAAIDAYGALVGGVIPAAWISEALFTFAYKVVRRREDPPAATYLMGYDSTPIRAEKSLYDLAQWARDRDALTAYLLRTPAPELTGQLGDSQAPEEVPADDWRQWQQRLQEHLRHYGHTIYNLDFATPLPADHPEPVLETCKLFLRGEGSNPHARQHAAARRREEATQAMLDRLGGLRLRLFRKLLAPAQRFAPLREDGLADVGLAYPLLRQMLLELGHRLTHAGMIEAAADVFWLEQGELQEALGRLQRGQKVDSVAALVRQRQATWRAARRLTPPLSLAHILGREVKKSAHGRRRDEDSLKGVACSPGRTTAPARVLHGPEDFDQMQPGDVLVASITTPAWTPLFAMASAIVTDVGGPLSHGSIVAREYGIPAVLGTGSATRRIRSGQTITVDGSAGKVLLSDGHES